MIQTNAAVTKLHRSVPTGSTHSQREVWPVTGNTAFLDSAICALLGVDLTIPILFPNVGTSGREAIQGSGSLVVFFQFLTAVVILFFIWRTLKIWNALNWRLLNVRLLSIFLLFCGGSLLWGVVSPIRSLTLWAVFAGSTSFAYYLVKTYTRDQLALVIGRALAFLGVVSILLAVLLPQYGIDSTENVGAWQGAFSQKNYLGQAMGLYFLTALAYPRGHQLFRWTSLFISSFLIVMSGSREAWLALFVAATVQLSFTSLKKFQGRNRVSLASAMLLVALTVGAAAYMQMDAILLVIGRNSTLTNRTMIWGAALRVILRRPILGYGIASTGGTTEWADVATSLNSINLTPAPHSIYLDGLLRFGAVGSCILLSTIIVGLFSTISAFQRDDLKDRILPLSLLLFLLLVGIASHELFRAPNLESVIFFASLLALNGVKSSA